MGSIYIFFKPSYIKQNSFDNLATFEIFDFTLYELDANSMLTLMQGDKALKYDDRYDIININYTDNSKKNIANIQADKASYKDDSIKLDGNVRYDREDGLIFKTDSLVYDKNKSLVFTNDKFILFDGANSVKGKLLKYNNILNTIIAKDVIVKYQLEDGKW